MNWRWWAAAVVGTALFVCIVIVAGAALNLAGNLMDAAGGALGGTVSFLVFVVGVPLLMWGAFVGSARFVRWLLQLTSTAARCRHPSARRVQRVAILAALVCGLGCLPLQLRWSHGFSHGAVGAGVAAVQLSWVEITGDPAVAPAHWQATVQGTRLARPSITIRLIPLTVEAGRLGHLQYSTSGRQASRRVYGATAVVSFSAGLLVALATLVLFWVPGARPPRQCPCGYDLTGNVSGTCPECGQPAAARAQRYGK